MKELLNYDPSSGTFTRRVTIGRWCVGTRAGSLDAKGYEVIVLDGTPYKAHRLAWLYMTGKEPPSLIDHKNRSPAENRWTNLRCCNRAQNFANSKLGAANKSGYRGVYWEKGVRKWRAVIRINGSRKSLGFFDDIKEASLAYSKAAVALHGEYANV